VFVRLIGPTGSVCCDLACVLLDIRNIRVLSSTVPRPGRRILRRCEHEYTKRSVPLPSSSFGRIWLRHHVLAFHAGAQLADMVAVYRCAWLALLRNLMQW
jgi:hypothetical protein